LGTFTVQSVHLFKSDLKPDGPVYTSLFSARLGNFEKDKI
jgi:2'-5' RNA ligase